PPTRPAGSSTRTFATPDTNIGNSCRARGNEAGPDRAAPTAATRFLQSGHAAVTMSGDHGPAPKSQAQQLISVTD
ncbi:MAG: hypothetical protein VB876_01360, partial [Pirellulales bacterium]